MREPQLRARIVGGSVSGSLAVLFWPPRLAVDRFERLPMALPERLPMFASGVRTRPLPPGATTPAPYLIVSSQPAREDDDVPAGPRPSRRSASASGAGTCPSCDYPFDK